MQTVGTIIFVPVVLLLRRLIIRTIKQPPMFEGTAGAEESRIFCFVVFLNISNSPNVLYINTLIYRFSQG